MTTKTTRKPPAYRQRKGYDQAIVTLTDSVTGKRRDYWLGEFGSPESREVYYRVLAEYEALGHRLPDRKMVGNAAAEPSNCIDVDELALEYWQRVARDHLPKRNNAIRMSLRLLRQMDGSTPVDQYGPRRLRLLREAMVAGDPNADPPRRPWSRTTVNDRVRIIVSIFRWGVTQEIVPVLENGKRETRRAFHARLMEREKREITEWKKAHRWHPHQLRHNAATRIRRQFGLEAAQLVLGHSSAVVTDAVYAERDMTKVADVIRRVG